MKILLLVISLTSVSSRAATDAALCDTGFQSVASPQVIPREPYTESQKRAIYGYTSGGNGSPYYTDINRELRSGDPLSPQVAEAVKQIDEALKNSPIARGKFTRVELNGPNAVRLADKESARDKVIVNPSYVSVTPGQVANLQFAEDLIFKAVAKIKEENKGMGWQEAADKFAQETNPTIILYDMVGSDAPGKGVTGIPITAELSKHVARSHQKESADFEARDAVSEGSEEEVLLARNSGVRVLGVENKTHFVANNFFYIQNIKLVRVTGELVPPN